MIVVVGATGNIGHRAAQILLERGQKVRAVVRNADKAKDLKAKGAEIAVADVEDSSALAKTFSGADAAFIMIPPNIQAKDVRAFQNKVSEAFAKAIESSKIKFVVSLSSIGAHRGDKMGPVNGLYDHEQRLNKISGVNILHLRPAYFMENLLMNVGLIKKMGIAGSALKPDAVTPMIATRDIAAEVAERLSKRDFKEKTVKELLGQRDVTMKEVTRVLGDAIGKKDLNYVQFPYADAEKAMVQMGLSADYARLLIEMTQSLNEGVMRPTQDRNVHTTTPTSIEEFANKTFVSIFNAN